MCSCVVYVCVEREIITILYFSYCLNMSIWEYANFLQTITWLAQYHFVIVFHQCFNWNWYDQCIRSTNYVQPNMKFITSFWSMTKLKRSMNLSIVGIFVWFFRTISLAKWFFLSRLFIFGDVEELLACSSCKLHYGIYFFFGK